MKRILSILVVLLVITSCILKEDKFVIKTIDNKDILIKWYYYSYITSFSPEYVVICKENKEYEIFKAKGVITDVKINNKEIIIKLYRPEEGIIYTKKIIPEVLGYKILLDSNTTYKDYLNIPDAVKE